MKKSALFLVLRAAVVLPLTLLTASAVAEEPGVTVLHDFGSTQTDGQAPYAPLIFDTPGNLYGVTEDGGSVDLRNSPTDAALSLS